MLWRRSKTTCFDENGDPAVRSEEIHTLRLGFELDARLIDTAEMFFLETDSGHA